MRKHYRDDKMNQWQKVLATETDNLNELSPQDPQGKT